MDDRPPTLRIPAHGETPPELAGAGSRAYAFLIDLHLRLLAALAVLAGLVWGGRSPAPQGAEDLHERPDLLVVPLAIFLLYHPILETLLHATPGKRWTGLRIVARDGGPASFGALLVRNLLRIVDMLPALYLAGLGFMLATRRPSRIGDLVAGTLVVHGPSASRPARPGASSRTVLLQEWLARWTELDPAIRDDIAHRILGGDAEPLAGAALREHVRARLAS